MPRSDHHADVESPGCLQEGVGPLAGGRYQKRETTRSPHGSFSGLRRVALFSDHSLTLMIRQRPRDSCNCLTLSMGLSRTLPGFQVLRAPPVSAAAPSACNIGQPRSRLTALQEGRMEGTTTVRVICQVVRRRDRASFR